MDQDDIEYTYTAPGGRTAKLSLPADADPPQTINVPAWSAGFPTDTLFRLKPRFRNDEAYRAEMLNRITGWQKDGADPERAEMLCMELLGELFLHDLGDLTREDWAFMQTVFTALRRGPSYAVEVNDG